MKLLRAYCVSAAAILAASPTAVATTYYLSGTQRHTDFTLRATDRIIAAGNLRLECARDARIEGTITGCPGFKIEVVAANELHVRGSIVAGHGVDGDDCLEAGTNGGSVELKGTTFFLYSSTDIRGGRGGDAGNSTPGAAGAGTAGAAVLAPVAGTNGAAGSTCP